MVGKACRQGHEGADHTMSTAGSRVMKVYAQLDSSCSSFYLVWNIRSWDDPTHMSLPFSRRALPRHTQKCLSGDFKSSHINQEDEPTHSTMVRGIP